MHNLKGRREEPPVSLHARILWGLGWEGDGSDLNNNAVVVTFLLGCYLSYTMYMFER